MKYSANVAQQVIDQHFNAFHTGYAGLNDTISECLDSIVERQISSPTTSSRFHFRVKNAEMIRDNYNNINCIPVFIPRNTHTLFNIVKKTSYVLEINGFKIANQVTSVNEDILHGDPEVILITFATDYV